MTTRLLHAHPAFPDGAALTVLETGAEATIPETTSRVLAVGIGFDMTGKQANMLAGITGYAWRAQMGGRQLPEYEFNAADPDLIVFTYYTHPRRSDPVAAWADFTDLLTTYVREGSPLRTTDRAGTGTAGTRLVPGFGNHAADNLRLYADQTIPVTSAAFLQALGGTPTQARLLT